MSENYIEVVLDVFQAQEDQIVTMVTLPPEKVMFRTGQVMHLSLSELFSFLY